ncbi:MAG TPA: hypothetical protein PKA06_16735, partial [Gemmatales bacterium]|nr:hypothetical protein [Gemmatales bacterium]
MSQVLCPYCATKLMLPRSIAAGVPMQCAKCQQNFLPPVTRDSDEQEDRPRKKNKKKRQLQSNTLVLYGILAGIMVLLAVLGVLFFWQPSYEKFNDAIVVYYNRMMNIMRDNMQARAPGNNLPLFLKNFQPLSPQLKPILQELQSVEVPEDAQYVLQSLRTFLTSTIRFSEVEASDLAEKLRKRPNDQEALQAMVQSLMQITQAHDAFITGQHGLARKHGLQHLTARS